jgi:cyanate permease
VLVGAVHDLTDSWPAAVTVLLVLLVPQAITGVAAGRRRVIGEKGTR